LYALYFAGTKHRWQFDEQENAQLQNTHCQFQRENAQAQLFRTKLYYLWKPAFLLNLRKHLSKYIYTLL